MTQVLQNVGNGSAEFDSAIGKKNFKMTNNSNGFLIVETNYRFGLFIFEHHSLLYSY